MPNLIKYIVFGLVSFVIGHTATEKINNEQIASVSVDSLNNIYRLRLFKNKELEKLEDTLLLSNDNFRNPFFISKSDSNDHLLWIKNVGGSPFELPNKLINDTEDGLYLIGSIGNQFAFNQTGGYGIDQTMSYTAFIVKYDADGKELWSSFIGGLDVYRYFNVNFYNNSVIIEGYFDGFYTKRNVLKGSNIYWRE